jgi:hypothetical protein
MRTVLAKRAAETVAWWSLGGERDDWQCELPVAAKARMVFIWLGWEINKRLA